MPRVADDVAQGIDTVVAAPIRQHDGPTVHHADEAGRIAPRRAIQPFRTRSGENDEGRGLDEAAIMIGDVVDLLDHGRAGRLAVEGVELSFRSDKVRHGSLSRVARDVNSTDDGSSQ